MLGYVEQNMMWVASLIRSDRLMDDEFMTAYRSLKETMLNTYYIAKLQEIDNPRIFEMMEKMDQMGMRFLWRFVTGMKVDGMTPSSVIEMMVEQMKGIKEEFMAAMTPEERITRMWLGLEKLKEIVKEGKLMKEGKEMLMKLSEMLSSLKRMADSLPEGNMLSKVVEKFMEGFEKLWNHATNGFFTADSTPGGIINMMSDGLEDLKKALEEAWRWSPRNRNQNQQMGGMNDNADVLEEIRRSLADLGRRMGDNNDRDMNPLERMLETMVDTMRQLHEDISGVRRAPGGPEQLVRRLSENLRNFMEQMQSKMREQEDALDMVRSGVMDLTDFLGDRSRGNPADFFGRMIDGMMKIVEQAMQTQRSSVLDRVSQMLRNMRNGGEGGQRPSPPMLGGNGGDDDMRRQFNELQQRVMDLMDRVNNNRNMGMNDNNMQGNNNMMGNNMMGNNMMGNNWMDSWMQSWMEAKEEPCKDPFFTMQIPKEDKNMWDAGANSYFGMNDEFSMGDDDTK